MTTTNRQILFLLEAPEGEDAVLGELSGYASVYGKTFMGEWGPQQIGKGSFAESIQRTNGIIPIFYQHGWAKAANAVPIGHALVEENSRGLKVQASLYVNDLPEAKAVALAAKAGALREWSIGFLADETTLLHPKTGAELSASDLMAGVDGAPVERTDKGTLLESSVVVKGANPWTTMVANEAGGLGAAQLQELYRAADAVGLDRQVLNGVLAASGAAAPSGANQTSEDAVLNEEKAERAWSLLADRRGREIIRQTCYDGTDDTNPNEPEVNAT